VLPLAADPAGTIDRANVALFGGLARDWWDANGPNRLLHRINPARLAYVRDTAAAHFGRDARRRRPLDGLAALDVGCGGGLVAEPLARMGASVTAIDAAPESIEVARAHAVAQGLAIDYRVGEIAAIEGVAPVDLLTCLEVVEHVADVPAFLAALRRLVKPGGLLIFSSPNRTAASLAVVKFGAEYVARAIPKGGHDWRQFLTPGELTAKLHDVGFRVEAVQGFSWSPATGFRVTDNPNITYIGHAVAI
jgi:2-polyprenyl-6-hydroxyphenyl methylase/3-demethylubiquinone-9 3-methyltransferase